MVSINRNPSYYHILKSLLSGDLDFHGQNTNYASHNFHAFAAKFPPQLPAKFITELTNPGDVVLDPMVGSGTTIVEAYLNGRFGIGFDIDPLALKIATVKVTPIDVDEALSIGQLLLRNAMLNVETKREELDNELRTRWNLKTKEFVDYWFEYDTQLEIMSLVNEIKTIEKDTLRDFFDLTLSGIIITKSGGVSLALDLAHTRPHRAKLIFHRADRVKEDDSPVYNATPKLNEHSIKYVRSAFWEFKKKFRQNLESAPKRVLGSLAPKIELGNAKSLPLDNESVDLIVTSPPYPSNAIDYMRAHKFSLVWLGYNIDDLSQKRQRYIGSDATNSTTLLELPDYSESVVQKVMGEDVNKGRSLRRYYSEMTEVLIEMFRVLKPGKTAVIVVGNSKIKGVDSDTAACLKEIGQKIGFDIPKVGVRKLDRDRRMMPVEYKADLSSQIQQRMHEEFVLGCYKPEN
ncbi:MAG: site-specific DNA-methyltransferase [Chloroflexi bacterium]|nr:site-specific DNA-methyltransferase [Chloroflexota bacterium]